MRCALAVARPEDAAAAFSVLEEARAWLSENGIEQWTHPYPRERFLGDVARGEVYLASLDGELAGTITVQHQDDLWGDQPTAATYIHRFAVRRRFAGQGIGREMLAWAEALAASHGKRWLRLDCAAHNDRLCRYYEEAGFTPRGTYDGDWFVARLYEKAVGAAPDSETGR